MSTTRGLGLRPDRAAESAGPGLPTREARARRRRPAAWLLLAGSAGALSSAALGATPRDLEERVACQRRVEAVYWSHRIWPSENPGPKPPLTAVLSRRQLVSKVERSRLEEAALERVWGERLAPARIQAELDRVGRSTRRADLLRELFAALEHDPDLVAECLVRPRLAARALRERYAWDREIHGEVRRRAESELAAAASWSDLEWGSARTVETLWVREDAGESLDAPGEHPVDGEVRLGAEEWDERLRWIAARTVGDRPGRWPDPAPSSPLERLERRVGRGPSPLFEEADRFAAVAVLAVEERAVRVAWAIWPKEPFDAWFERVRDELRPAPPEPGSYRLPPVPAGAPCANDSWSAAPGLPDFVPATRRRHTAVWTGTEMIVWGGFDGSSRLDTGGRYDPATDTWVATSRAGAPSGRELHRAVWTGTEMIVWGGYDGDYPIFGGRYDPSTDSWSPTSTTGTPSGRSHHSAVWTGTEMIVWGGYDPSDFYSDTGGRYDPGSDSWAATTTSGAPSGRNSHGAVWTGTEMVVWGGYDGAYPTAGGRYDPGSDSWTATTASGAPGGRVDHTVVWTGSEMIVWGGYGGAPTNSGGRYDPSTDGWAATTTGGAPSARSQHGAVWTGAEMLVWGGDDGSLANTGGRYDPGTDSWTPTATGGAPSARVSHSAVWTGSEMIAWGGYENPGRYSNSGGRYDPGTDSWAATAPVGQPSGRDLHTAVWTGAELIVWGGFDAAFAATGGRYDPATDSWTATSMAGAPSARFRHTAVWTGTQMLVWGGNDGSFTISGGRYDPATDGWTPTSETGAPPGRTVYTAVWTGTEMIVWGGWSGSAHLDSGGRYDPSGDSWTPTALTGVPVARQGHTAVWTGTEMIVWGGFANSGPQTTGSRYDPSADSWTATTTSGVPSRRSSHVAVWTGTEMIVWGGWSGSIELSTGGRYDPAGDAWTATNPLGAPSARVIASAVWTGEEMVVWGGDEGSATNTGGRYDPGADAWTPTSTAGAATARYNHAAVWTGAEMIVWGGWDGSRLNTGGRYCVSSGPELDFGDAPDPSYPTLLASDGARHALGGALFLGASVDADPDGQPTAGADGDDVDGNDDEDGVVAPATMLAGAQETIEVTASATGLLNAWIDFDADGDWLDAGEQVATDAALSAGVNDLLVSVPLNAAPGTTIARFRVDSAGGLAPNGPADDGEVEDHAVVIAPSAELGVAIADAPDPVLEGGQLTYVVTVTNNGSLGATGVTLVDTLPAGVLFVSSIPGQPTCVEGGGVVTCSLGALAATASVQVEILVDVPVGVTGTLVDTAEVTLDQTDPIPANNTDTETTTVTPLLIFADGFETGDTSRWSQTVP